MKKELKDYLHLYLGCKVETEGARIIPLDIELLGLFRSNKIGLTPILRPLSDMTGSDEKFYGGRRTFDPLEMVYLLSRHFDLFDLIESGLAIDATTLKIKP